MTLTAFLRLKEQIYSFKFSHHKGSKLEENMVLFNGFCFPGRLELFSANKLTVILLVCKTPVKPLSIYFSTTYSGLYSLITEQLL